jgi:hypothetical protein
MGRLPVVGSVPIVSKRPAGVFRRVFFIQQIALRKNGDRPEFIQVLQSRLRIGESPMVRRTSMLSLAGCVLTLSVGCRSDCGGGWFSSSSRGSAPCQTVSQPGVILDSTGQPIGGAPGAFVPGNAVPLIPGSPGTDLPYPQPADLIPRTGVPVPPAIPTPAPGDGGAALLPAPQFGVPVKGTVR